MTENAGVRICATAEVRHQPIHKLAELFALPATSRDLNVEVVTPRYGQPRRGRTRVVISLGAFRDAYILTAYSDAFGDLFSLAFL